MTPHPPKRNSHIHSEIPEKDTKPCPQTAQPQYSSIVAQTIQALGNLLTSVNKDTLIIVIFSAMLFGGGYLLYLQVKALEANTIAVERNTSVSNEMKIFIQEVVREIHEKKIDP